MVPRIYIISLAAVALLSICSAQQPFSNENGKGSGAFRPLPPARDPGSSDPDPECVSLKYRTLTGRCTSEMNPALGEARRVQSSYFDVNSAEAEQGFPNARQVSNIVCNQEDNTENSGKLNEMFTFFGQFMDHDFALTPLNREESWEIEVLPGDPELSSSSLGFFRSQRAPVNSSTDVERPITLISSALDLSNVYGSDEERNAFLRVEGECRLKTSGDDLLPLNTENFVNAPSTSSDLFIAGDIRAGETPMLTSMHTIWVREHNNVCDLLENAKDLDISDPEELYQIARSITIAEYQKIVYNEWLPAFIGSRLSQYTGYKPSVDPTVSVEFTTAAFRFGHTLVGSTVSRIDSKGKTLEPRPAKDMFFQPSSEFTSELLDEIIRGATAMPAQELDEKVVDTLRNFLFENVDDEEGFDLMALNLQRSRDHNIPTFNELRKFFVGSEATSFAQISSRAADALEAAYGDVGKVEAWIGLMAEEGGPRSVAGPTLSALMQAEFERLRDGDRFFYLRSGQIPAEVLRAIRKINSEIFTGANLFNRILQRTTNIEPRNLAVGKNAFKV
ncbi:hypothetical protein FGB62_49g220 [Gracilaria domingensis]|nr:hypothetical protein FGB62_49g220 [Gracilaria domingensis]